MFIFALAILGLLAMLLWNALIPDLFHGPFLNYWQAVGLVVLSRVLVGIRGPRRGWWKPWHKRHWKGSDKNWNWGWDCGPSCGPSSHDWRKWAKMSPEERQQAKEEWKRNKTEWKQEFRIRFGEDKPEGGSPGV
ncbi:MAG: hypothetical protein Q8922_03805 [Bacteroidota bacterium]|nr:hypothetical protein [Bacteroidota bacterium]MDP4233418.1 hypothetical protein [Bacteroidota bacterium]MDP4242284.1 hypothetical protein [Bacteroidota bacterium]MDP4287040.1 hypothetical protein [Bacteroidota bacterium]